MWLQSRLVIHASWPRSRATASPDLASYSVMSVESPAAARNVLPGEKANARTGEDCVGRECRRRVVEVLKM